MEREARYRTTEDGFHVGESVARGFEDPLRMFEIGWKI
jgi:hypothetical protein